MKRRVLFILLLLVAGAIVNFPMVMGLMLRTPQQLPGMLVSADSDLSLLRKTGWEVTPTKNVGHGFSHERFEALGTRWRTHWEEGGFPPDHPRYEQASAVSRFDQIGTDLIAGWPCKALVGVVITEKYDPDNGRTISPEHHFWLATLPVAPYLLPLRPIWPGFAINTVFYAFIVWLLFAAPFALRRRMRIKRGQCPKCAYPVGTSERCTECGTSVGPSTA